MRWRSVIMTAREFSEFRRDLERGYREEIAAGKAAGYTFFSCKQEDLLLLHIPPGAVVLFERAKWLRVYCTNLPSMSAVTSPPLPSSIARLARLPSSKQVKPARTRAAASRG